jgi:hypothetical protein
VDCDSCRCRFLDVYLRMLRVWEHEEPDVAADRIEASVKSRAEQPLSKASTRR